MIVAHWCSMVRIPRFAFLFAVIGFVCLTGEARGSTQKRQTTFCFGQTLSIRNGTEFCWARFQRSDGTRVCVTRAAWKEWLKQASARSAQCMRLSGPRPSSWLRNDEADEPKRVIWTYRVDVDASHEPGGVLPLAWVIHRIERWRERISAQLASRDRMGVLRRLFLDERHRPGASGQPPWKSEARHSPDGFLRMLGFVHLYSASGIHLYAAAYAVERILFWAGAPVRFHWLCRWLAGLVWLVLWMLNGLRAGMLRPVIVVCLRSSALALGVRWTLFSPLILALAVDLAVASVYAWRGDAGAWAPGRWHYALAVGGGLVAWSYSRSHWMLAWGSWLPTAFLDLFHMRLVALATPVLSFLTIPVFSAVVYPIGLLALVLPEPAASVVWSSLAWISEQSVGVSSWLSLRCASLWGVYPSQSAGNALVLVVLISGLVAAFCVQALRAPRFRRYQKRAFACLAALVLAKGSVAAIARVESASARVSPVAATAQQLDVGQGDAALIAGVDARSAQRRFGMIDVGSAWVFAPEGWVQLLVRKGVRSLDWVALSHLDEDHAGALRILSIILPINCVATAREEWRSRRGEGLAGFLSQKKIRTSVLPGCFPYRSFSFKPSAKPVAVVRDSNGNEAMSAFVVPLPGRVFYVNAGDASARAERKWAPVIASAVIGARRLILKVSHHGSRHSTHSNWLQALKPDEAWVSSGLGNRYGHPSADALSRLYDAGIRVRRTDREGGLSSSQ